MLDDDSPVRAVTAARSTCWQHFRTRTAESGPHFEAASSLGLDEAKRTSSLPGHAVREARFHVIQDPATSD